MYECKEDGRFELMQVYHDPNVSSMHALAGLSAQGGSCSDVTVKQPFVCSARGYVQLLGLAQDNGCRGGAAMDSELVRADASVGHCCWDACMPA